jgi:predicted RNA binding protein YcfA (HicA-like mRNA interferase family)
MSKIPRIKGSDAVRAFESAGFVCVRTASSHHILKKKGCPNTLSIPDNAGKKVGKGLLKSQITAAGLTVDEFIALL